MQDAREIAREDESIVPTARAAACVIRNRWLG